MTRADLGLLDGMVSAIMAGTCDGDADLLRAAIAELTILRAGKCATCDKVVPVLREEVQAARLNEREEMGYGTWDEAEAARKRLIAARAAVDALEGKVEDAS